MMLLTLHVIAIGMLVLVVGTIAYRMGYGKAESRYRRLMEHAREDAPGAAGPAGP